MPKLKGWPVKVTFYSDKGKARVVEFYITTERNPVELQRYVVSQINRTESKMSIEVGKEVVLEEACSSEATLLGTESAGGAVDEY